jgi:hypothetical protein
MTTFHAVWKRYTMTCQNMGKKGQRYNSNYDRHRKSDGHERRPMNKGPTSSNKSRSDYSMTCNNSRDVNRCWNRNSRINNVICTNELRTTGRRWHNRGRNYSTNSTNMNGSDWNNRVTSEI